MKELVIDCNLRFDSLIPFIAQVIIYSKHAGFLEFNVAGHCIPTTFIFASGDINIKSSEHAISGKDSVRIAGGTIKIIAGADGINSSNDEDPQKGYVYIAGGSIEIDASDDGIHAETKMVIEDGNINIINSEEGIEGAIVEIAGGELNVISKDDGINASDGSTSSKPGGNKPGDSDSKQ